MVSYCTPVSSITAILHGSGLIRHYIQLQTGANDARSDDTSRLKAVVAEWLNSCALATSHTRLSAKGKEERGINHNMTGKLLCPIKYDWDDAE
jgi:hypothetical protein